MSVPRDTGGGKAAAGFSLHQPSVFSPPKAGCSLD